LKSLLNHKSWNLKPTMNIRIRAISMLEAQMNTWVMESLRGQLEYHYLSWNRGFKK
jgi:hypothetical protein